jgi:hypothetical protein
MKRTNTCGRASGAWLLVVLLLACGQGWAGDIWVIGPSHKVARNEKPPAAGEIFDAKTKTVNLFAARNEFVAFQIVYAGQFKDVNVEGIQITGPSPIKNIDMFREHYLPCTILSQWDGRKKPADVVKLDEQYKAASWPRDFPDQMVPLTAKKYGAPFDVAPEANEAVWVDVFVPESAAPGDYTGTFKTAGQSFNIKLTVWNFALPSVSHFPQWGQTHPENIAWGFNKSEKKIGDIQAAFDGFYQMAHNHRLVLMEEWMDKGQVNDPKLKFLSYGTGEGFKGPFGAGFGIEVVPVMGTGMPLDMLKEYYNRTFAFTLDEPQGADSFKKVREIAEKTKAWSSGKVRNFVTTAYDQSLEDAIDIFCSPSTPPEMIPALEKKGKVVWTYNDGYAGAPYIDAPGAASRTQAWAGFVTGSRCWYFWQACYWADWQCKGNKNSLRKSDEPAQYLNDFWNDPLSFNEHLKRNGNYPIQNSLRLNGDGVLFYPGKDVGVDGPIASFRLKNIRQGGTDFEYLYLLEKMGKKDAALAEANKLLGAPTAFLNVTDAKTATPKFTGYDLDGSKWDAARIRLGKLLNEIGDKALREKIVPYNQYPNPAGSPDYYGGQRY